MRTPFMFVKSGFKAFISVLTWTTIVAKRRTYGSTLDATNLQIVYTVEIQLISVRVIALFIS